MQPDTKPERIPKILHHVYLAGAASLNPVLKLQCWKPTAFHSTNLIVLQCFLWCCGPALLHFEAGLRGHMHTIVLFKGGIVTLLAM